jgi:hypothetical protein
MRRQMLLQLDEEE